ncbi:MAG: hypothetical protein LBN34_07245 [Clostridiales Family XIII bacterium]|jgi:hypothetical protein|nr:hypothetical protein [Clostridiales Family XIII bacterium]
MNVNENIVVEEPESILPFLYENREYPDVESIKCKGTTTCIATTTSPVKEFTPDD